MSIFAAPDNPITDFAQRRDLAIFRASLAECFSPEQYAEFEKRRLRLATFIQENDPTTKSSEGALARADAIIAQLVYKGFYSRYFWLLERELI